MEIKRNQALLDLLAENARCPFISDLRHITGKERLRLAEKLEAISPGDYLLPVLNDALNYLIKAPPQQTPEAARGRLLDYYKTSEEPLEPIPSQ